MTKELRSRRKSEGLASGDAELKDGISFFSQFNVSCKKCGSSACRIDEYFDDDGYEVSALVYNDCDNKEEFVYF